MSKLDIILKTDTNHDTNDVKYLKKYIKLHPKYFQTKYKLTDNTLNSVIIIMLNIIKYVKSKKTKNNKSKKKLNSTPKIVELQSNHPIKGKNHSIKGKKQSIKGKQRRKFSKQNLVIGSRRHSSNDDPDFNPNAYLFQENDYDEAPNYPDEEYINPSMLAKYVPQETFRHNGSTYVRNRKMPGVVESFTPGKDYLGIETATMNNFYHPNNPNSVYPGDGFSVSPYARHNIQRFIKGKFRNNVEDGGTEQYANSNEERDVINKRLLEHQVSQRLPLSTHLPGDQAFEILQNLPPELGSLIRQNVDGRNIGSAFNEDGLHSKRSYREDKIQKILKQQQMDELNKYILPILGALFFMALFYFKLL